jgi:hypothetical protein
VVLRVEKYDARTWSDEQLEPLFGDAFPAFIVADKVAAAYIKRVREWFTDLSIMLTDDRDTPVACGWGVPIRWDGTVADLPWGYTDTTRKAVEGRIRGEEPDTFVICGGIVSREVTGRGMAAELISALRDLPAAAACERVIAPIRPTLKSSYPLTPIDTYASWTRDDGTPLDPWLRSHLRMGAAVLATAPHSQTMTGTVEEWQGWTGMRFPSTGDYVIPKGLSTLHIDRELDLGTYTEPNIWVRHK